MWPKCGSYERAVVVATQCWLFTRVPLEDRIHMLSQHFQKETKGLIQYILTTTYFVHDGTFYEQTDGVAVESPLAPVITDL